MSNMADKMDVDAVNGEEKEESVGPAPDLPPERSMLPHKQPAIELY